MQYARKTRLYSSPIVDERNVRFLPRFSLMIHGSTFPVRLLREPHGRIHRPGAAVRWRQGIGPSRGRWCRLARLLFTQGTVGLVRQARERFGRGGTRALGRDGRGWCLGRSTG